MSSKGFQHAYEGMKLPAVDPKAQLARDGLAEYNRLGFLAWNASAKSHRAEASRTLAYAFDDWALAEMARLLGKTEEENSFRNKSQNYRNIFDQ